MKKIAVFVEGQTELITVREFLLKKFSWEVNLVCLELYSQSLRPVPYKYESPNATIAYQIVNIGNDKRVLSAILEREESLWKAGFIKLIGLRDMYSKEYKDRTEPPKSINSSLNNCFIEEIQEIIDKRAKQPDQVKICFSIMEIESWFLGMYKFLERINPNYSQNRILERIGVDIALADPEVTFFHPSDLLDKIFALTGNNYKKHESDIEMILAQLQNEDFENLYSSPICQSFNKFHDELLNY